MNQMQCYLDTVVRLDGVAGFITATHWEYALWCVKWEDEPDPRWTSPEWIAEWDPNSGVDHFNRLLKQYEIDLEFARIVTQDL